MLRLRVDLLWTQLTNIDTGTVIDIPIALQQQVAATIFTWGFGAEDTDPLRIDIIEQEGIDQLTKLLGDMQ